jgi:uncharacterized protein (DUF4415 family)
MQFQATMKNQYDFEQGQRGAVLQAPLGKTRITIRIDDDILQWFRSQIHAAGGGNYQTLINLALRKYIEGEASSLSDTLRAVVREELAQYDKRPNAGLKKRKRKPL